MCSFSLLVCSYDVILGLAPNEKGVIVYDKTLFMFQLRLSGVSRRKLKNSLKEVLSVLCLAQLNNICSQKREYSQEVWFLEW